MDFFPVAFTDLRLVLDRISSIRYSVWDASGYATFLGKVLLYSHHTRTEEDVPKCTCNCGAKPPERLGIPSQHFQSLIECYVSLMQKQDDTRALCQSEQPLRTQTALCEHGEWPYKLSGVEQRIECLQRHCDLLLVHVSFIYHAQQWMNIAESFLTRLEALQGTRTLTTVLSCNDTRTAADLKLKVDDISIQPMHCHMNDLEWVTCGQSDCPRVKGGASRELWSSKETEFILYPIDPIRSTDADTIDSPSPFASHEESNADEDWVQLECGDSHSDWED